MPIYEYRCNSCGKEFNAIVPSFDTADIQVKCPNCSEKNAERKFSMKASIGGSSKSYDSGKACSAPAGTGFG